MPPVAPFSPASPWMNMNDLAQYWEQGANASFDPSLQENLNVQNTMANEMQDVAPKMPQPAAAAPQPSLGGGGAVSAGPDFSSIQKLMKQFDVNNLIGTKDQQDSIAQMKKFRDAIPLAQVGADLSPLMALSDSWSPGGKLLQGYKAPETTMDKLGKVTGLNEKIGATAGKLSDDQLALLRDKLNAEMYKLQYSAADKKAKKEDKSQAAQYLDKDYVKDYNDFIVQGGYAETARGINNLKTQIDNLKSTDSATGGITGYAPKFLKDIFNPEASAIQENVEETIQKNMKQILGAAFTEKEGKNFLARTFNPRLPEEVNAARLEKLVSSMEEAYRAKMDAAKYFEENDTLDGFKGKTKFTFDDFEVKDAAPSKKDKKSSGGFNVGDVARNKTTGKLMRKTASGWEDAE